MAKGKKGALYQLFVPMVDSTDFASIESAITASDFTSGVTAKFYGMNHGGSAATTSGTISKAASLVRSGVFRICLNATENNYDVMMARFNKTGCAEQIFVWENVDNDDSDLRSAILLVQSVVSDAHSAAAQANSRVLVVQSMASDAHSAAILGASHASDAYSAALLIQSRLSDFDSRMVSDISDVRSAIALIPTSISASDMSDIASRVWATTIGTRVDSRILVVQSLASDARSAAILGASHASDALSQAGVASSRALVIQSRLSDFDSRLVSDISDVRSAIALIPVAVSASDMSDIASRVWATAIGARVDSRLLVVQSLASDAHSAAILGASTASLAQVQATAGASRALLLLSNVSDVQSALAADYSDLASKIGAVSVTLTASDISDIASAVAAAVTTVTASDISDIASAVWANAIGARVDSRMLLTLSRVSDAQSAIAAGVPLDASTMSDIRSAITAGGAAALTDSNISDIASAVWANAIGARVDSRVLLTQSRASDAHSAAAQANSRVLLNISTLSDVQSYLAGMSGMLSDAHSAAILGASTASTAQVQATAAASRALLVQSRLSDLDSRLAADVSNLVSQLTVVQSMTSDAHSAAILGASTASVAQVQATAAASRALLVQSQVSDIHSLLSNVHVDVAAVASLVSDVQSAVAAGVELGASTMSDIRSAITANGVLATGSEPTTVVAHSATFAAKLDWITALARNKQTLNKNTGLGVLRNDADDSNVASRTDTDDGSVYQKGRWQ